MVRVADYIADYIYKSGVKDIFLVSGGGMMFLLDGIAQHPYLNAVCNHHEQASAMAAVSYAKYTGKLGVAYVTTGCGGTNAITGLLDAWQDSVPCIFISGPYFPGIDIGIVGGILTGRIGSPGTEFSIPEILIVLIDIHYFFGG